jgi:hypothetical protein
VRGFASARAALGGFRRGLGVVRQGKSEVGNARLCSDRSAQLGVSVVRVGQAYKAGNPRILRRNGSRHVGVALFGSNRLIDHLNPFARQFRGAAGQFRQHRFKSPDGIGEAGVHRCLSDKDAAFAEV